MRMIEAELLSPFLQSIAEGTVGIELEIPLFQGLIVRDSLRQMRLRAAEVLRIQGTYREDRGLIKQWTSTFHNTPDPLRFNPSDARIMRELTGYHMARKIVSIGSRLLDIIIYSLGPDSPERARTIMITSPTIADLRGFLILTRRGTLPTQDTYGRLLTITTIQPRMHVPIFTRFANLTDEKDFGGLVSFFEQTEQTDRALLPSTNGRQIERFSRRWGCPSP